jgi:hypothetical protein
MGWEKGLCVIFLVDGGFLGGKVGQQRKEICMELYDHISINLDAVITSGGSMISAWAGGQIVQVTEKAVRLQAETENGKVITCWFPRKALKATTDGKTNPFDNHLYYTCTLAKWFKGDDWVWKFISLSRDISVLRSA